MRKLSRIVIATLVIGLAWGRLHANSSGEEDGPGDSTKHSWDLSLIYEDWKAWEADLAKVQELAGTMDEYKGRLSEGPEVLAATLKRVDKIGILLSRLRGYTSFRRDLDQRNNKAQARYQKLLSAWSRISKQTSWMTPELLEIPRETMESWIEKNEKLQEHAFSLRDNYRQQKHILDEAGEEILASYGPVANAPSLIYQALSNADPEPPVVTLEDGSDYEVTASKYRKALNTMENAADRRTVQSARMEQFQAFENTYATIYDGVIKKGWAEAQARNHESTIASKLADNNIPQDVVETLVSAAREGKDALIKYHQLRKKWLEVDGYGWSDMHVPLIELPADYGYDRVADLVIESVAPLGDEYRDKMKEQLYGGFVDVPERRGKRPGAYNSGIYGVGSFVLLNHQDTLDSAFTVAHEMGHSMHTRLAQENQPFATHRYTIFVAEVASILNEKLFLSRLMEESQEPRRRVAFLEKQIQDISGTFFLQTMMADYELRAHKLGEQGEGITAEVLTDVWREVVTQYFGDTIREDDPYFHSWARIPHLYRSPFYVYQYATCYASAATLMESFETTEGDSRKEWVTSYLNLLESGGSDYPMEQLKEAGVDLTKPDSVKAVVREFSSLVDALEREYEKL